MADQTPLFLASASPRRRELLTKADIPFELLITSVDEDALSAEYTGPLNQLGEYLARCKAFAAWEVLQRTGQRGRVLASDTTVLLNGQSLAKPRDTAEARAMLEMLRDREHIVATGVALIGPESGTLISDSSETRVLMRDYSDDEVAAYVATGDPLDKAGAYSIQHPDFHPVARITGCHLGVIGLPVCIVAALLHDAPLPPTADGNSAACMWSKGCHPPLPTSDTIHSLPSAPQTRP